MVRPVAAHIGVTLGYRQKARFDPNYIHRGIDYGCGQGTKVVATIAGRVVHAGRGGMGPAFGIHVVIETGGIFHIYAHLSREDVSVGASVGAGQQLGLSGATGNVTGAHLHYGEFTRYHYQADRKPQFIDAAAKANTTTAGKPTKSARPRYEVTASLLNGRGGPGTDYRVLSQRTKGFQFTATRVSGDWVMASKVWYHTGYLKIVDPTKPKPTPAPRPTPTHVEWYPGAFLNMQGDDSDEGTRTFDARLPKMATDLTLGLPAFVTGCEVRAGAQATAVRKALKAKGYPNFIHADGNFFASRAGNPIEFSDSFTLPKSVQGGGRDEALLRVRAKINGHHLHVGVMHLDYRPGSAFDDLRVDQAKACIDAMSRMGEKFDLTALHRQLIVGDPNSHNWVRDKAFLPAGYLVATQDGLDQAYVGAHPDRPVLESSSAETSSDHPVIRFTIGKKA